MDVRDISEAVAELKDCGGLILSEPDDAPDIGRRTAFFADSWRRSRCLARAVFGTRAIAPDHPRIAEALLAATHEALPDLKRNGRGAILMSNGALGVVSPETDGAAVNFHLMGLALSSAAKRAARIPLGSSGSPPTTSAPMWASNRAA